MSDVVCRIATPEDLAALEVIDQRCFPPGSDDRQAAAPGELGSGIAHDLVVLAEVGGGIVGFVHAEQPNPRHVFLAALAVDPSYQGIGVGKALLSSVLDRVMVPTEAGTAVTTVTSPANLPMISLLLASGFVARTLIEDYFGPGRHRLYCQLLRPGEHVDASASFMIPMTAQATVRSLLGGEAHVVSGLVHSTSGSKFEVSRLVVDDTSALQTSEASAGIAFSTAILASLTFLLGFSFASDSYPAGARLLLTVATVVSLASLIVYANATGDIARLGRKTFWRSMKWGNVMSEYGGVHPVCFALAATFAAVSRQDGVSWIVAAGTSAALGAYECSPFALRSRFPRSLASVVGAVVSSLLPLGSVAAASNDGAGLIWAASCMAVLVIRSALCLANVAEQAEGRHGVVRVMGG